MFFTKKEKLNINTLNGLFEAQRKTLLEYGYPMMLGISLEEFNKNLDAVWKSLSEKINTLEINIKGNIPLLLVVGQGEVTEKIKKIKAHTELDLDKIEKDGQGQLNGFYVLLDVEDGQKMVAKSPKDGLKRFEKEGRRALTINESIALLTHYPKLLKDHYLISAGSFYTTKDNESLPLLWLLDEHGNPELHYAWFDIAHGSYGAASYAIKM